MSAMNVVVWGESGEGKSTLINNLVGSEVAKTGKTARGVTKDLCSYEASVEGVPVRLWDLPGAGDKDVPPYTALQWLEHTFKDGLKVDGLLILSKNADRIHIGGSLVMQLMNLSFSSKDKWESVALVGTHKDKWDDGDEENFRGQVLAAFNQEVGGKISKVATISKTDFAEVKGLIKGFKGMGDFKMPAAKQIAETVCAATGVKKEEMTAEMDKIIQKMEENNRKLTEALAQAKASGNGKKDNFKGIHLGPLGSFGVYV